MATVDFFKHNNKNKNTTSATNTWFRHYERWATETNRPSNLLSMEKLELNAVLESYFAEAVRKDGKQYEPTSLGAMQAGIDRYLRENGSTFLILKDVEFSGSRNVIEGRAKYLRELGMGKKPNAADSFTKDEESVLWNCGALGSHSAQALVNTIHMLLTKHLGLRGRQEHHLMKVEDFVYKLDDSGDRYITFKEGVTKTRQGGTRVKQRKVVPKMFETREPGRCPLFLFEQFILRRPVEMRESGVFYLAIIHNPAGEIWFKRSNLGENTIDNLVKNMVNKTPLANSPKNFTNHSWRKTTTKRMRNAGATRSEIIEVTGHSHESGLDPYDSGDDFQAKRMSFAIDGHPPPRREDPPHIQKPVAQEEPLAGAVAVSTRPRAFLYPGTQPPANRSFRLLSEEQYEQFASERSSSPAPIFYGCSMTGCTVTINQSENTGKTVSKRRRIMIESDSSQE